MTIYNKQLFTRIILVVPIKIRNGEQLWISQNEFLLYNFGTLKR